VEAVVDFDYVFYYVLEVVGFIYSSQLVFNEIFESDIILVG
jgi:hypothetical protein